jgi:hypothetical protein
MSLLSASRFSRLHRAAIGLVAAMVLPLHAGVVVNLAVEPPEPAPAIASDFNGLSFEMQLVLANASGTHFFSPANQRLIATFKTLGIKSLRVGGNTADRPSIPIPNDADVDNLFAFAKAADVKVIYTLRLLGGDLEAATKTANYISHRYSNQLECFAIGNEPNTFSTNYETYLAEWKRYAARITEPMNSPDAKFCGPSVSPGHEKWSARFAGDLAGGGLIKFISQHDYPGGDARRATNVAAARDKLLAPAMDDHYAKFAANFVPAVISNHLPFRLEEANSFYDGGALDASDTFAAALWALDYQWWWATQGAGAIYFHTGDKVAARDENKPCRYAIFWSSPDGYQVHPIGYALKMFSLGSAGRLLRAGVENTEDINLSVYAVAQDPKQVYVTLINREHGAAARAADVLVNTGFSQPHAQVMRLQAAHGDIAAKTSVTLGGAEIREDGSWDGKWTKLSKPGADGKIHLTLPAASAALVKIVSQ